MEDFLESCQDILQVLLPLLARSDIYVFSQTSRRIYSLVDRYVRDRLSRGDQRWNSSKWMLDLIKEKVDLRMGLISLQPSQWYIKESFSMKEDGIHYIQAPMSYGKTIVGLAIASSPNQRYLICVPPKALATWIKEAQKMYGPGVIQPKNPACSCILVAYNSTHPRHNDYVKAGTFTDYNKIILTTTMVFQQSRYLKNINNFRLIIDEVATGSLAEQLPSTDVFKWICLLSANYRPGVYTSQIIVKESHIQSNLPTTDAYYWKIPSASEAERTNYARVGDQLIRIKEMEAEYCKTLYEILKNPANGNKMVIFFPAGQPLEHLKPYLQTITQHLGITFHYFDKSLDVVEQFHRCQFRSVLLSSHNNSEAVNIHADSVCVLRPDWLSFKRVKQLVGRVLRSYNPHKMVKIHYITSEGIGFFRSVLANAIRSVDIDPNGIEPPSVSDVVLECALLKHAGYNYYELPPIDLLAIFMSSNKQIYNEWKSSPHILPDSLVETIHNYKL